MNKKKWGMYIGALLCLVLLTTGVFGCTTKPEPAPAPAPAPIPTFATQKDMNALGARVLGLEKTSENLDEDIEDLNDLVASLPRNSGASQSSVDAVRNELINSINSMESRISSTESDISVLRAAITDLNEEMEADTSSPRFDGSDVDPEDAVELELRYFPLYTIKAGDSTLVIPMRLKSENMLNAAISDVIIALEVRSSGNLGVDKMTLAGGGATWLGYGSGNTWSFENWSDIKYKALEDKTFTPTLSIVFDAAAVGDEDITLDIEAFCDDYELD